MSQFLEISKGIVEDFLQTAVFLDDQTTLRSNPCPERNQNTVENDEGINTGEVEQLTAPVTEVDPESVVDIKAIVNSFMKKGIVCSVIQCDYETFENEKADYVNVMRKSDIIVVD